MSDYTLPTTQARRRFLSLVKDAGESFSRYVITYRGRPEAVMMGFDEFEGWLETLEIEQSDTWKKALRQAKKEDAAGRHLSYESVVSSPRKASRRR